MDFLKKSGFVEVKDTSPQGRFDVLREDDETDMSKNIENHTLYAKIPVGVLGFNYTYYGTGEPVDGRCSIDVTPFEKQYIRQWKEWDNIRDTGWEYWLQILYNFIEEGA